MMQRILSGSTAASFGAGAATVLLCGCFFNAGLPLENDPPVCVNRSSIVETIIYPDSSVCTLSIDDGNDSVLDIWTLPCTTGMYDPTWCDSIPRKPWPGDASFLNRGYGTKRILLMLDTNRMGRFSGVLILQDGAAATVAIPYTVNKIFFDPFDPSEPGGPFPLAGAWWRSYVADDSMHIRSDFVDRKLIFSFGRSDDACEARLSTGIRTVFSLETDFYTTVDFKLRDEMDDAFEVAFFISTSPDTGRWAGEKAGIFITGIGGRLRFECRSVNLQSYSYESGVTAGELGIRRADSTISCFFHDGNPANTPKPLTSQFFPEDTPVYVHLKMSVRDLSRNRNCYWNDFSIPEGLVRFPEK